MSEHAASSRWVRSVAKVVTDSQESKLQAVDPAVAEVWDDDAGVRALEGDPERVDDIPEVLAGASD